MRYVSHALLLYNSRTRHAFPRFFARDFQHRQLKKKKTRSMALKCTNLMRYFAHMQHTSALCTHIVGDAVHNSTVRIRSTVSNYWTAATAVLRLRAHSKRKVAKIRYYLHQICECTCPQVSYVLHSRTVRFIPRKFY